MLESISALEMRKKFGSLLDRVSEKGDHITILRGQRALAVLIPAKEYEEKFRQVDKLKRLEEVLSDIESWRSQKKLKPKKKDASEVVRQMRENR